MDIKEKIKEQIKALQVEDTPSDRFLFFQSLFKKYNPLEIGKFDQLTEGEWLGLFLIVNNEDISLEEVKERIAIVDQFIENKTPHDLKKFLLYFEIIFDKVAMYEETNNSIFTFSLKSQKIMGETYDAKLFRLIDSCLKSHDEQALADWKEIIRFKADYIYGLDYISNEKDVEAKRFMEKNLKFRLRKVKGAYHFTPLIQKLQEYQNNYLKEQERRKRKRRILKQQYEEVLKAQESGIPFKEIKKEWKALAPDIQIALIKQVLSTQNEQEKKLQQEERNLEKHKLVHTLLIEHGVHPSILAELEKENFDEENLKEVVNALSQACFPMESITNIATLTTLLQANKETVSHLLSYVKTGAITIDFLNNHPELLTEKETNTKRVFDLLQQENGNFTSEYYDSNLLLVDASIIEERIRLAKFYGFTLGTDAETFNLLREEALFDLVDFAIEKELPLEEIIKIKGTKEELQMIQKRLFIAQNFGLEIMNDEDEIRYNILNGSSFIVPNHLLDEVIVNDTLFHQEDTQVKLLDKTPRRNIVETPWTKALDETYLDEEKECYNFQGVRISRGKILRNLAVLKEKEENESTLIYQAALYNTFLSQEEIDTLKTCLFSSKQKRI